MSGQLPDPRLRKVYRLEATLGAPLDLGEVAHGHRRIVPQTGGTFTGPELSGKLLPGASADWQIVLPDGTSFGDIRYTLQTDGGDLLYVQSRGVRHGSAEVLARLGRGEDRRFWRSCRAVSRWSFGSLTPAPSPLGSRADRVQLVFSSARPPARCSLSRLWIMH